MAKLWGTYCSSETYKKLLIKDCAISCGIKERLKPLVKELFSNISKKIEATVYDQIQKLMEDGRK